jgi:hypothetical protein
VPAGCGAQAWPGPTRTGAGASQQVRGPALPWTRPQGTEGGGGMMLSAQNRTASSVNLELQLYD